MDGKKNTLDQFFFVVGGYHLKQKTYSDVSYLMVAFQFSFFHPSFIQVLWLFDQLDIAEWICLDYSSPSNSMLITLYGLKFESHGQKIVFGMCQRPKEDPLGVTEILVKVFTKVKPITTYFFCGLLFNSCHWSIGNREERHFLFRRQSVEDYCS